MNKNIYRTAKRILPVVSAIVTTIGTVAVGVLSAKNTPKALKHIEEANAQTGTEKLKAAWKDYAPAAAVACATSALAIGTSISTVKTVGGLTAALAASTAAYKEYRDGVKKEAPNVHQKVSEKIAKGKVKGKVVPTDGELKTFYEPVYGHTIVCTEAEMFRAENEMNRLLMKTKRASMDDLYRIIKFFREDEDTEPEIDSCNMGWHGEQVFGVDHVLVELDDGLTMIYLEYEEWPAYLL